MKTISHPDAIRRWRKSLRAQASVGFVPTMGALHEGHLTLVRRSLKENDVTVVSIFVNPIQFGPKEDFSRYPRPFARDVQLLKSLGVDVLFYPTAARLYPYGFSTSISVNGLNSVLCGDPQFRGPSHFNGVATVVAKLFNLVQPTRAYFGMKDFQQVRVLEQMVDDLNMDVKIVRCPTVREKTGLAMSSRNAYLSEAERQLADRFNLALQHGRKLLTSSRMKPQRIRTTLVKSLTSIPNCRVEYVEFVDPDTLQRIDSNRLPVLLAAAIRLGNTRLIDNILIQ